MYYRVVVCKCFLSFLYLKEQFTQKCIFCHHLLARMLYDFPCSVEQWRKILLNIYIFLPIAFHCFKKKPTFSKWSCVIHRVNFFEFWTVALTNTTRFLHFHKKSHHHGVISSCQSVVIQLLRIFWWFLTGLSQKSVWSRDTTCISPSGSYNYANAVIIRALCSCFS